MLEYSQVVIKTTHDEPALIARRDWFLAQPGCSWVKQPTGNINLPTLFISRKGVWIEAGTQRLSFHPSMALLRLLNIFRDSPDRFVAATGLQPGNVVMDATLGLGTDALVAAWAVGPGGRVTGVESSPVLAAIVRDGLAHLPEITPQGSADKRKAWYAMAEATERINVVWADHLDYLRQQPTGSVDVGIFDPMFRHTRRKSASILPLHLWSDPRPLRLEAVHEACRVARQRVVLKERKDSREFTRLGFRVLGGGKYSAVDYGVIPLNSCPLGKIGTEGGLA